MTTNKEFAGVRRLWLDGIPNPVDVGDPTFKLACELAGVRPSGRQAGKWRRGVGAAWVYRYEAMRKRRDERRQ